MTDGFLMGSRLPYDGSREPINIMDGILLLNKPAGITSHDVVDIVRKKFNIKKVGHAGTLDPIARGLLVILIGKATKLSSTFVQDDKEYVATLFLGKRTDTQDSTGRVIEEKNVNNLDIDCIKKTLSAFMGSLDQVPPMVSAKRYKGKRLYELAREGKSVPRQPQSIQIYAIDLLDFNSPEIVFRVRCSKGTYVRTLCEEIGKTLGYPAHMSDLLRTRSGIFSLKEAKDLDTVSEKDIHFI
ncbi:tRNA pseudouridine(55) synthase TruB [Candidatus Omnitrophota bacterium]